MEREEQAVKERILQAAVDLIREEQEFERISMRRIAEKASVAVSMVNYHFQTKANLIDQAVQTFVGKVIRQSKDGPVAATAEPTPTSGLADAGAVENTAEYAAEDPVDAMRRHLKRAASFVARNPGISRVSIMRDMKSGASGDNSSQVAQTVYRQLQAVFQDSRSDTELRVMAEIQTAAVQNLFLRAKQNRMKFGLDFFEDHQREELMDIIIDTITSRREK